ncbi:MAG: hypothetical protein OSJ27_01820 [Candidatus Gastranaerophilales bacterium]|nr:hypothetical protein [Candidatus Gastranaerophilales bacterium]
MTNNKKIQTIMFSVCLIGAIFTGGLLTGCAKDIKADKSSSVKSEGLKTVLMKDEEYGQNMYTPAFPLIYEDLKKEIVKKDKLELVGFNSYMFNVLNRMDPPENRLSEKYYYKTIARKTPAYKKKIENDIWKKFKEKSSILDTIPWKPKNEEEFVLYSMVKKNVEFLKHFEILDAMPFNGSKENVKYFGIKKNAKLYKNNVKPLFYENDKDGETYAISLKTKTEDEIILYVGNLDEPVDIVWDELTVKADDSKADVFGNKDKLTVPFIEIKELIKYVDLSGKLIKGTNYKINSAIESVEFSLDNKGAKLKNEAAMMVEMTALLPSNSRYFSFNKPFALFMIEKGKKEPYFMLKVLDTKYLVKE